MFIHTRTDITESIHNLNYLLEVIIKT
jgi:hypothetical protein